MKETRSMVKGTKKKLKRAARDYCKKK